MVPALGEGFEHRDDLFLLEGHFLTFLESFPGQLRPGLHSGFRVVLADDDPDTDIGTTLQDVVLEDPDGDLPQRRVQPHDGQQCVALGVVEDGLGVPTLLLGGLANAPTLDPGLGLTSGIAGLTGPLVVSQYHGHPALLSPPFKSRGTSITSMPLASSRHLSGSVRNLNFFKFFNLKK